MKTVFTSLTIALLLSATILTSCKGRATDGRNTTTVHVGEIEIVVRIATDELLEQYASYVEFFDENTSQRQWLIFTTNVAVREFRYISLELVYDDDSEQFFIRENSVMYELDILLPHRPFIVNWMERGTFPHAGASFLDENNIRRYFFIGANNADPEEDPRGPILFIERPPISSKN